MLKQFLEDIIKSIVDNPDEVRITEIEGKSISVLELHVSRDDFGKIIGKHGKNADALRTILRAVSAKFGKRSVLEILE